MGLLYRQHIMVKYVCYTGLWIHWFSDLGATIPNGSVIIGRTSLVGVGHSRSNSIVPLILRTVCCAMVRAPALYYRSKGTISTLLGRGNISDRPCIGVMTSISFSTLKYLDNYHRFYTLSFENPKTYQMVH
jgi:hypothetical protein